MRWPNDDPESLKAFYGDPATGEPGRRLVAVTPPFKMSYAGQPIKSIQFHRKAAPALLAALNAIWDHYERDQAKIDALGISKFSGAYNPRLIRGSKVKWSNHAYGAAIDLNAEDNGLYAKGNMPLPVIAAFKGQGALWGGDYRGRKDPMHFEFCSRGEAAPAIVTPVGFMPQVDADNDGDDAPAPKASSSKIGVTQVATGATATVVGAAEVANSVVGSVNDVADQVSTVTDKAGDVIAHTKTIVEIPKPGFWFGVLHAITSPVFIACVCVMIVTACVLTWLWHRDHLRASQ